MNVNCTGPSQIQLYYFYLQFINSEKNIIAFNIIYINFMYINQT